MRTYKPASVSVAAYAFCRYSVALAIWAALFFKLKWLVILVFLILAASAILKIGRAPMIALYSFTINKIIPSKNKILDEKAMRFAHMLGAVLAFFCLVLLYIDERAGWVLVLVFAIIKTVSALGFCPFSKLYPCAMKGGCCVLNKKGK